MKYLFLLIIAVQSLLANADSKKMPGLNFSIKSVPGKIVSVWFNWVFNAAMIYWPLGLAQPPGLISPHSHFGGPHETDEMVQRITSNFLKRCGISV